MILAAGRLMFGPKIINEHRALWYSVPPICLQVVPRLPLKLPDFINHQPYLPQCLASRDPMSFEIKQSGGYLPGK